MLNLIIEMTERGIIPDPFVRLGIRRLCGGRLSDLSRQYQQNPEALSAYVNKLKAAPVAVATDLANEQHYEVPADFFRLTLGPQLKYSSAFWPEGCETLADAEKAALDITIERAGLEDGMKILELGCGWGSLSLAMASRFPKARILAVSNSSSQKKFIDAAARARGLNNLEVFTGDVSLIEDFGPDRTGFDRVVSVEMFEHLSNYELMFSRINRWLAPHGQLFVHIFTHKQYPYPFETEGSDNWMGKYFFTGGQMPSHQLFSSFQKDLRLEKEWKWSGIHYQKTSEAWLQHLHENKTEILKVLATTYGTAQAVRWWNRWRIFFLSVAELFGYDKGSEWGVSHYLFSKKEISQ